MAGVKVKGVAQVTRRFDRIAKMELKTAMNKAIQLVHGQAGALAPSGDGDLRESIHMEVKENPNGVVGRVYTNVEYAAYVEFGTGTKGDGTYPYKVKGLNLEYASEPWYIPVEKIDERIASRYRFKKIHGKGGQDYYVCHGQAAQPYLYPALKNHERTIRKYFKDGVHTRCKENCDGGK